MENIDSELLVQ
ncbi:unnamed protein product [Debaryomyces tyrocola]|nr:unnamed protein product [Debaryomyces tyrocola]